MTEVNNLLRDFQDKYKFLINNITDVITEIDLDGTFTYVSPQVYDMLGYKPEEIIEKKFLSFIHPDDLPIITGALSEIIKSNEIFSLEYRVRHKKGHYVPISARGSLVKVKDKLKLIGILRDITEKKLTEQKLIESEEKWRSMTKNSPDFIFTLDKDEHFTFINKFEVLRLNLKNVIGKSLYNFMPEKDHELVKQCFKRVLESGQNDRYYSDFVYDDGTIHYFESRVGPILNEGNVVGFSVSSRDITERKKAEQKLKESEKKYHELYENSPSSILLIDLPGIIVDCNYATEAVTGYDKKDLVGNSFTDFSFFNKDTLKKVMENFNLLVTS